MAVRTLLCSFRKKIRRRRVEVLDRNQLEIDGCTDGGRLQYIMVKVGL